MPGETFSLTTAFHYDGAEDEIPYAAGYATMGGVPKKIYGG
jgi:hypothetical protein